MKRTLKYTLLTLAILITAFVLTVGGVVTWVYVKPKSAWHLIEKHYLPADLKISWKTARVDLRFISLLSWRLSAGLTDIEIKKGNPSVTSHIDMLSLQALLTLFKPKTALEIEQFTLLAATQPTVVTASNTSTQESLNPGEWLEKLDVYIRKLRAWNDHYRAGRILIEVNELSFSNNSTPPMKLKMSLIKNCKFACPIQFSIQAENISPMINRAHLNAAGDLSLYSTGSEFLKGGLKLEGKELLVDFPFSLSQITGKFQLLSDAEVQYLYPGGKKPLIAKPNFKFLMDARAFELSLRTSLSGLPGPLPSLPSTQVYYRHPLDGENWLANKSHLKISSPIPLFFIHPKRLANLRKTCNCKIESTQLISIESDFWLNRLLNPTDENLPSLDAMIRAQKITNKLFNLDIGATVQIFRRRSDWMFKPTMDSSAVFYSFKAFQKIINSYGFVVPAPINVLDGMLELEAKSPITFERLEGKIAAISAIAKLKADLKSLRQKVKISTDLEMKSSPNFKNIDLQVNAAVDDLILELPPLNPILGVPRVTLDPRIERQPKPKKPGLKITFGFQIDTTKPGAIHLLLPLAHPYIPISIHYQSRNTAKKDDYLHIEPFEIKYLRRTVSVDSVKINLNETKNRDFPIEAHMHVQQTDYKVSINVMGTTASPKIELSSVPYLEYNDIISVLLYDKPRDRLAAGDAETSSNVQAAIADRALGLFGLWAFAATPIRSFTYNPVTKVYTATIQLDKGVTAGIGTSTDQNASLELRKRLSKKLVIAASWSQTNETENSSQVVLQWEERF